MMVPPVPTLATKISTLPSVSFQISGPVVPIWALGFTGFTNCPGMKLSGISFASSSAFSMAPVMPSSPGVSTISAPYAFSMLRRSMLMVSGMVSIILYPFAAAMDARPIPVLPEVGSIITEPGFSLPVCSACAIMAFPTRSFTLLAGFRYSSLTNSRAFRFSCCSMLDASTRGVFPTSSITPL